MDWKDTVYSKDPYYVFRRIEDESLLIPIKKSGDEVHCIFTLNEVAARIWELVDGVNTGRAILKKILAEYEVATEDAEKDLEQMFRQLEAIGGLKIGQNN